MRTIYRERVRNARTGSRQNIRGISCTSKNAYYSCGECFHSPLSKEVKGGGRVSQVVRRHLCCQLGDCYSFAGSFCYVRAVNKAVEGRYGNDVSKLKHKRERERTRVY